MNKNYIVGGILVVVVLVLLVIVLAGKTNGPAPAEPVGAPLTTPGSAVTPEPATAKSTIVVLDEQNGSGETGIALITETDAGKVKVDLGVNGAPADADEPAHIHLGSCTELGGVKYPLSNVLAGVSETTLDIAFDQLSSDLPLAVNVHKSADEIGVFVACGDLSL